MNQSHFKVESAFIKDKKYQFFFINSNNFLIIFLNLD